MRYRQHVCASRRIYRDRTTAADVNVGDCVVIPLPLSCFIIHSSHRSSLRVCGLLHRRRRQCKMKSGRRKIRKIDRLERGRTPRQRVDRQPGGAVRTVLSVAAVFGLRLQPSAPGAKPIYRETIPSGGAPVERCRRLMRLTPARTVAAADRLAGVERSDMFGLRRRRRRWPGNDITETSGEPSDGANDEVDRISAQDGTTSLSEGVTSPF